MGGSNANQLIEHVRSYDPRSWSCLHVSEGALSCNNVTVQHNDIGPCGSDLFQQWADGISVSCQNSLVHNNTVNNPTVRSRVPSPQALIDAHLFSWFGQDGGIVLFGSPGTLVENNTIWVETVRLSYMNRRLSRLTDRYQMTLLGGINMVDYDPWNGNYTNTIVRNNMIFGGFATDPAVAGETKGENDDDAIIK